MPCCDGATQRCHGGADATIVEQCYWETLGLMRRALEVRRPTVDALATQLRAAQTRLNKRNRKPRQDRPLIDFAYVIAEGADRTAPPELALKPGTKVRHSATNWAAS